MVVRRILILVVAANVHQSGSLRSISQAVCLECYTALSYVTFSSVLLSYQFYKKEQKARDFYLGTQTLCGVKVA